MSIKILNRSDTKLNWERNNPILEAGEIGVDLTTGRMKVGVGKTWKDTPYQPSEYSVEEVISEHIKNVNNTILELDELPEGDASYSGKIVKVGNKIYVGSYKEWEETTTETLEAFTPFQVGDNLFDYTPHINTNLELNDEVVPTVLGETDLIILHPDKFKLTMVQEEDDDGIQKYIVPKFNFKPGTAEGFPEGGWGYLWRILYMAGSYSEINNEDFKFLFDIEMIEEFNLSSEGGFTQEDATITYINDDPQWQTLLENMGFNIEYEETNTEQKSEFTWIELTNKKYVDTAISQAITGVLEGEV